MTQKQPTSLLLSFLLACLASANLGFARAPKPEPVPPPSSASAQPLPALNPATQKWIDAPMSAWMEKKTRSQISDGNKVVFLKDGPEFFPVRLAMIRAAQAGDTIDLSTFLWCDDPAGILTAQELAAAEGRGVRVRIVLDFMNEWYGPHEQVYSILENAGIPMAIYNPPYWGLNDVNNRSHEKVMIWNGALALVGGANLCDEYQLGKNKKLWHDFEMYVVGPSVARMQSDWDATFNWIGDTDYGVNEGYESVMEDPDHVPTVYRKVPHYDAPTPSQAQGKQMGDARILYAHQQAYMHKEDTQNFIDLYSQLIRRTQKRVVIYMPYSVPPKDIEQAIEDTAKAGKEVDILTNSEWTDDNGKLVSLEAYRHVEAMARAGAQIYEIHSTVLHGKAMLVDDTSLVVGSHNFDNRSFLDQGEASIITGDQAAIAKFSQMAEDDMKAFHHLSVDEIVQLRKGAGNRFIEAFGKLFQSMF